MATARPWPTWWPNWCKPARLGLNTATKMINSASRGFILRMNHPQLRVVAAYLREIS